MPTEVHTLCFHTRDAVERNDSRMVFEMPLHRVRDSAAKLALGSVEFPMVQWTVEPEWNRLYVNEGIKLSPGRNELKFMTRVPEAEPSHVPTVVGLPPMLNRIVSVKASEQGAVCECQHPHYLFSVDEVSCVLPALTVRACLLGHGSEDISLFTALEDGQLSFVSSTAFFIGSVPTPSRLEGAYLYVPATPSPTHLCQALTVAARGVFPEAAHRVWFDYVSEADQVDVRFQVPQGTAIRVLPCPLATAMGLSTVVFRSEGTDLTLPGGPTNLWDHAEIPCGFYGPCHRPMCTGQPLRFGSEMETAFNRFYFPLPSQGDGRLQTSPSTPHALVFGDCLSRTHLCPIPCGRYDAKQLSAHLEKAMTAEAGEGMSFSVFHENDRFVFACERKRADGRVEPCPFSILFNHPLCTESWRFGFPAQLMTGDWTYCAPESTRQPSASGSLGGDDAFGGILRVDDVGHQKRFRFHSVPPPTLTARVIEHTESGLNVLRTHVNKLPYSHGYRLGDVVRVRGCEAACVLMQPVEEEESDGRSWQEVEHSASGEDVATGSCVVAKGDPDPTLMTLEGELIPVGTCVHVSSWAPVPWNMTFSRKKVNTIDGYMLGFPSEAVQWGIDGSVDTGKARIPPFLSPNVHALDHPDYVLITLNESSSASLEHSYGGESKHIFCKLSLYPLFREERMLPRDTTLQRGTFSRFEIAFWNPDMKRPYHFHGAEFSFSLNLLFGVPDA